MSTPAGEKFRDRQVRSGQVSVLIRPVTYFHGPGESLKAMVYFEGGDLHILTPDDQQTLIKAVSAVRDLPSAGMASRMLALTGA